MVIATDACMFLEGMRRQVAPYYPNQYSFFLPFYFFFPFPQTERITSEKKS